MISEHSYYEAVMAVTLNKLFLIGDPVIICPLDDSHRIQISKLQGHLERCLIGDLMEITCPWNRQHIVDEANYKHHVNRCPDMPTADEPQNQSSDYY